MKTQQPHYASNKCFHLKGTLWWSTKQSWDCITRSRLNGLNNKHWPKVNVMIDYSGLIWNQEWVRQQKIFLLQSFLISELPSVQLGCTMSGIISTASCLGMTVDLIGPLGQVKSSLFSTAEEHGRAILAATSGIQLMPLLDFNPSLFVVRHHKSQVPLPQGHAVRSRAALGSWGYTTVDGLWKELAQGSAVISLSV